MIIPFSLFIGCNNSDIKTLSLPALFADNMVLQRNAEVQFWGIAAPLSKINISSPLGEFSGKSNVDGTWKISLSTTDYKGPFSLQICDDNSCESLKNIVLGEVWLASGQSNMQMPLEGWLPNDPIANSEEEIANAHNFDVRFFTVERSMHISPQSNVEGSWQEAKTSYAGDFSATAYFFAKEMHQELGVPIGIIHSSWGGTPVESWIGNDALQKTALFDKYFDKLPELKEKFYAFESWLEPLDLISAPPLSLNPNEIELKQWNSLPLNDQSFLGINYDDDDWQSLQLPGSYNDVYGDSISSDFDGIAIVRKTFHIKNSDDNYALHLGSVDDMEFTYINGTFVGSTIGSKSFNKKKYSIPKGLLKKGENVIAMRVIDTQGGASIGAPITLKGKIDSLSLEGDWKVLPIAEFYERNFYRIPNDKAFIEKRPDLKKLSPYTTPTVLFNGMIRPLIPFTIAGALWYQGESNVRFHTEYDTTFPGMIVNWRDKWGYDFPFYFVQIAPFDYGNDLSPDLRNSQLKASAIENTGMVVTLDIGNPTNIHPANKEQVGIRLADLALGKQFDRKDRLYASKPTSINQESNQLVIGFNCEDDGLKINTANADQIEISEDNLTFFKANVTVDGCFIKVSSPNLRNPKFVRHAWRDVAEGAIINTRNIPISPFHLSIDE